MDRYKNIYQLENAKDQSYIKLELDLSGMDKSANGLAKFNIYRVGYAPGDLADKPFKTFTIKKSVVNNANKNEKHAFDVKSFFGKIYVSLDGEKDFYVKDNKPAEFVPPFRMNPGGAAINLNPIGEGGDYLAFGMVCQIGFAIEPGQHARFSDLEIRNIRKPANIIFTEDLNGEYAGVITSYSIHYTKLYDNQHACSTGCSKIAREACWCSNYSNNRYSRTGNDRPCEGPSIDFCR